MKVKAEVKIKEKNRKDFEEINKTLNILSRLTTEINQIGN